MWSPFAELAPGGEDEVHGADPGKDLFALLALTFLVICVLFMVASRTTEHPTPVDTAAPSRVERPVVNPPPAVMRIGGNGIEVVQEGRSWNLPAQAGKVALEAQLREAPGEAPTLLVDPPGSDLNVNQLLQAIRMLNEVGVHVSFLVASTEGGANP